MNETEQADQIRPEQAPKTTPPRDRITVCETVYHQRVSLNEDPLSVECTYTHFLETDGEAYCRRNLSVGEQWQKLDIGWIESCSLLVIKNEAKGGDVEKRMELASQYSMSPAWLSDVWEILPGQSHRGRPSLALLNNLWIRSSSGECRYSIFIFPG